MYGFINQQGRSEIPRELTEIEALTPYQPLTLAEQLAFHDEVLDDIRESQRQRLVERGFFRGLGDIRLLCEDVDEVLAAERDIRRDELTQRRRERIIEAALKEL